MDTPPPPPAAAPAAAPRDDDPFADETAPPADIWQHAKEILRGLVALYGAPAELAAMGVLTPKQHGEVLVWLRPVEAIVRLLLLVAAAARPRPKLRAPARPHPRVRRVAPQDREDSESWHVVFRVFPPAPRPRPRAGRTRASGLRDAPGTIAGTIAGLPSPWPLAERLEAVIRVLENPEPYARRLAARLTRRRDLVRRAATPAWRPDPRKPRLGDTAMKAVLRHVPAAAAWFDTG